MSNATVPPAMGCSPRWIAAHRETIERDPAEVVVAATLIDLAAPLRVDKPVVRARHEFAEAGEPTPARLVEKFLAGILRH